MFPIFLFAVTKGSASFIYIRFGQENLVSIVASTKQLDPDKSNSDNSK